jgi:hypothetical protein
MKPPPFKICPTCAACWETRDEFLADPELKLAGYQVAFENLKGGLFFFNHLHQGCFPTLALPVDAFASLSEKPLLASRGEKPACCPDLCVREGDLEPCPVACECVWVREIMQILRNWEKKRA